MTQRPRLVLVTGVSGSGKSVVAKCFEDLNYYTVDNIPLPLLRDFLSRPLELARGYDRIAVVTDVRAPGFAEQFPRLIDEIDRERLGLDETLYNILETPCPYIRMPVTMGRNVGILVEIAARNHVLKSRGHHSAREFARKLEAQLERNRKAPANKEPSS